MLLSISLNLPIIVCFMFNSGKPGTLILIFLLLLNNSNGQELRKYAATRLVGNPPEIDGVLEESVWETAEWTSDFIQREPFENEPPAEQTAVKILYDNVNLYVAIRCFDSEPEKIERRLSRRDSFEGDWVGVAFDSYDDDLTAFSFAVNAAGVKSDGIVTNDADWDETWNPVYYVKVTIDDLGWVAEFRIPYNQLRFAEKEEHKWGFQVLRWYFRKEELSLWQIIPRESVRWVSLFGEINNIRDINPKKEVEIIPYIAAGLDKSEPEEGNPFTGNAEFRFNAGVDGKVAVSNDLTLNYTINPDFGQVEADPSVVNLSAYEVFFEERRPFFIEGSNIYNFLISAGGGGGPSGRDNLFYSRRIGDFPSYNPDLDEGEYIDHVPFTRILGALKLSGKTRKGWSVGIMESLTNEEKAEVDMNGERYKVTTEPMTNYFNTRIQKDINKGNATLGGMFTSTHRFINDTSVNFLPSSAYSSGFDFDMFWKEKTYYLSGVMALSYVTGSHQSIIDLQESPRRFFQRPDATHLEVDSTLTSMFGYGGSLEGGKIGKGRWRYGLKMNWRSPMFELNDIGYLRTSDNIHQEAWVKNVILTPFSIFRFMETEISQYSGWDYSGLNKWSGASFEWEAQFRNYFGVEVGTHRAADEIEIAELRGGPAIIFPGSWSVWGSFRTDQRKRLVGLIWGTYRWGDHGWMYSWNLGGRISYRPMDALDISVSPEYRVDNEFARYVETLDYATEKRYILSSLLRHNVILNLRINLSITPDLTLQYWGQPFLFAGEYSRHMKASEPRNEDYYKQFYTFSEQEITYDPNTDTYYVDETGDGSADYSFENPDFSVYDFRSNLVMRWEYIPGSFLYLVWSQGRYSDGPSGDFNLGDHLRKLADAAPNNVILLKFSYRFSF